MKIIYYSIIALSINNHPINTNAITKHLFTYAHYLIKHKTVLITILTAWSLYKTYHTTITICTLYNSITSKKTNRNTESPAWNPNIIHHYHASSLTNQYKKSPSITKHKDIGITLLA